MKKLTVILSVLLLATVGSAFFYMDSSTSKIYPEYLEVDMKDKTVYLLVGYDDESGARINILLVDTLATAPKAIALLKKIYSLTREERLASVVIFKNTVKNDWALTNPDYSDEKIKLSLATSIQRDEYINMMDENGNRWVHDLFKS
jgi:hypothetical protein